MDAREEPRSRVLVVDDNGAIHEDFHKILARDDRRPKLAELEAELFDFPGRGADKAAPGYVIDSAYQGQEALLLVEQSVADGRPYAVAFVDMRMPPGWDGVETIERIWQIDPRIEVVICTAYSDHSGDEIVARLAVEDRLLILKKPFDAVEVSQLASALSAKWKLARSADLKLAELERLVAERTASLCEANERLRASEARYALAAAGSNDGLWDWDVDADVVFYSARWQDMIGAEPGAIGASLGEWLDRVHEGDRKHVERELVDHDADKTHVSIEYRMRHADGHHRWMLCRGILVRDEIGRLKRMAGSQTDITDRKVAEAQLLHDALHDTLTGLPNRALLSERIERCLLRQQRHPEFRFAVMFIDLDHFKVINDSLGHVVGDALLVELSRCFQTCVRANDTLSCERNDLARLGGDEFVLLLEGMRDDADAIRVAERLLASVEGAIEINGHPIHASLSIGIAAGSASYGRAEDVLRDADTALHRAKADGRGRYRIFSEDLHSAAVARWETENALRKGIDAGQLYLEYQPIVDVTTEQIVAFEALVRWRHPTRNVISPMEFIPLAEETGLIVPLGRWVLEEACKQAKVWHERLPEGDKPTVSVNVAARQFVQPGFVDEVRAILEKTAVAASVIKLEVTESATMDACAIATCTELRELGIELYLDDFGTGYSSLSYLHRIPIQALKIDRSFVMNVTESRMNASIVQAILAFSRALGIRAVAEGVETRAQLDAIRAMGCTFAQGYLWSKPVSGARALGMILPTALSLAS